jgi:hypothetical protein
MTRFTLYSIDIRELVNHVTTEEFGVRRYEHAHFDIDDDGVIHVHVDGKGEIKL